MRLPLWGSLNSIHTAVKKPTKPSHSLVKPSLGVPKVCWPPGDITQGCNNNNNNNNNNRIHREKLETLEKLH